MCVDFNSASDVDSRGIPDASAEICWITSMRIMCAVTMSRSVRDVGSLSRRYQAAMRWNAGKCLLSIDIATTSSAGGVRSSSPTTTSMGAISSSAVTTSSVRHSLII